MQEGPVGMLCYARNGDWYRIRKRTAATRLPGYTICEMGKRKERMMWSGARGGREELYSVVGCVVSVMKPKETPAYTALCAMAAAIGKQLGRSATVSSTADSWGGPRNGFAQQEAAGPTGREKGMDEDDEDGNKKLRTGGRELASWF